MIWKTKTHEFSATVCQRTGKTCPALARLARSISKPWPRRPRPQVTISRLRAAVSCHIAPKDVMQFSARNQTAFVFLRDAARNRS